MSEKAQIEKLLNEIVRHAQTITHHRDDPCSYWEGQGCAVAMAHDADDILGLVAELRSHL